MFQSPWGKRRLLIPRWRPLQITLQANELAESKSSGKVETRALDLARTQEKLAAWKHNPNVVSAGELVQTALVEAKECKALYAARYLLSGTSSPTPLLRMLAETTLGRNTGFQERMNFRTSDAKQKKKLWRQRTRSYPTNSLAWVELSLHEVISGKKKAAERAMLVALQLAPNNRHVLRSASRLFLHLGDPERAYDVVTKSEAVRTDPWLMAAELSLAELAARHPRFVRAARDVIADGGLLPRQITELAGSLASMDLFANHRSRARRYFSKSMIDPTGSALAQAEWASSILGANLVDESRLNQVDESNEARVFHLLREERLKRVPDLCVQWLTEEPYAIRPHEIASIVTSMVGNHKKTLELTSNALELHPESNVILNNHAFALAHMGELDQARQVLRKVSSTDNGLMSLVTEANLGLVAMRQKDSETGHRHYKKAIRGFRKMGSERSVNVASIYFAREAALAGAKDAHELMERAREAISKLNTSVHNHVFREAERALASRCH